MNTHNFGQESGIEESYAGLIHKIQVKFEFFHRSLPVEQRRISVLKCKIVYFGTIGKKSNFSVLAVSSP